MEVLERVLDDFWKVWVQLYAPTLVTQNKWLQAAQRDLLEGDIVSVGDSNSVRGKYYLAKVVEVCPGLDGRVRKVVIEYRNFRVGSTEYVVSKPVRLTRAVQRLALLVPVEGEEKPSDLAQE